MDSQSQRGEEVQPLDSPFLFVISYHGQEEDPLIPETEKGLEGVAEVLRGGIAAVEEVPGVDHRPGLLGNCQLDHLEEGLGEVGSSLRQAVLARTDMGIRGVENLHHIPSQIVVQGKGASNR